MQFEEAIRIHVTISQTGILSLTNQSGESVTMIPFTGTVEGKYFTGGVLPGGVDTQIKTGDGTKHSLSARYILEGMDYDGQHCKIYIDNSGSMNSVGTAISDFGTPLFQTHPIIITDSKALDFLHYDLLVSEGIPVEGGIEIVIYHLNTKSE